MKAALEKRLLLGTAFVEGISVLVVEIGGARALAPYYGSSLRVWTAQITATLLFLALGYGLGGRLSRKSGDWKLGLAFWSGGLWLSLYPFMRDAVLGGTASAAGVELGSFLASAILFGPPLLCLGAVSPLLISRLDKLAQGAGSAAGALFFTNTLGGLAGGWLTALALIPHLPLRLALAGTGLVLVALGSFWSLALRRSGGAALAAPLTVLALMLMAPRPSASLEVGRQPGLVLMRQESSVGLIQVIDLGPYSRILLIDGITQGGMSKETGTSAFEFTEYLNFLSHRYQPAAKSALLLGLGSGLLAKQLVARGVKTSAAEVEPRVAQAASQWFGMPAEVRVIPEDARCWLNRTGEKYDLIFLDAFAGENTPWYLNTRQAFQAMKRALNPGGVVLVNLVTRAQGSPGQARIEAGLLDSFPQALVFNDTPEEGSDLVNSLIVAGAELKASNAPFPSAVTARIRPKLAALLTQVRPARPAAEGIKVMTDDDCDLDFAESELRLEWRRLVFQSLGPAALDD
jgi:spermidine synthase